MNLNNFMLQLDYRDPFNQEENQYYQHICAGIENQLLTTIAFLKSEEGKKFYNERAEYIEWLWSQYDLQSQLDGVINYNASSCDEFMDNFYHSGAKIGYEQLKRGLCFTPADEQSLNFIRSNNYQYVKKLNNYVANEIRNTIFTDIAQGNSYQKTINKLRELPLKPVSDGKISPDVRARMIARTERARARNFGSLQAYLNYGVEYYELITHGKKTCNICIDLEANNPYHISDSRAYCPVHPNCFCSIAPYIPDGQTLRDTPLDYSISIADYVNATINRL